MRRPALFPEIRPWRAADRHTGIGRHEGAPYTYQHLEVVPRPPAAVYRVQFVVPVEPLHLDTHYVPADRLARFFNHYEVYAAYVIDVRPLTLAEARRELEAFRSFGHVFVTPGEEAP